VRSNRVRDAIWESDKTRLNLVSDLVPKTSRRLLESGLRFPDLTDLGTHPANVVADGFHRRCDRRESSTAISPHLVFFAAVLSGPERSRQITV